RLASAAERESEQQFQVLVAREIEDVASFTGWLEESLAWLKNRIGVGLISWSAADGKSQEIARKAWEKACSLDVPHQVTDQVKLVGSRAKSNGGAAKPTLETLLDPLRPKPDGGKGKPTRGSRRDSAGKPPLKSWTQSDLDDAIRKYKADRSSTYSNLVEG